MFALLFALGQAIARAAAWLEATSRSFFFLATGTLRRADLQDMSSQAWRDFNDADADIRAGLLSWERDVYARVLRDGDRILVVGSGTGRDLLALAALGHQVVGIEPAADAVRAARRILAQEQRTAEIVQGFVEDVAIPGVFDVVLFPFDAYSYIPESARRIAVLTRLGAHLTDNGRVILTYLNASEPLKARAVALARIAGRLARSDWSPERGDVLHADRRQRIVQYEHRFTVEEIESEARSAGYEVSYHRRRPDVPTLVLVRAPART